MPVWQRSCGCAMVSCEIWWFLWQSLTSVAGWIAMVCMVMVLLHYHTGVLALVYVHFCGERGVPSTVVQCTPGMYIHGCF